MDQYGALIYRVAVSVVQDPGLAEDVVQEVLVKAWTSMPSWQGDVPVRWLRRVARNEAISVVRRRRRLGGPAGLESRASGEPDVERLVEGRGEVRALREALGELDDVARTLLVLRETEGLSYEDLADVVGLTPSAVRARLYRARQALKGRLGGWDR
ncbi:MAG: sigma-70 family RNA polymerase sigma factor [Acidimicrobiia bacterium]|nr:sigma-70 family RNA polymerase sigma factor [Acidimicrobiia bacterium]